MVPVPVARNVYAVAVPATEQSNVKYLLVELSEVQPGALA
jgi:hypothetical protein